MEFNLENINAKLNELGEKVNNSLNGISTNGNGLNGGIQNVNDVVNSGLSKIGSTVSKIVGAKNDVVEDTSNYRAELDMSGLEGLGNSGAFIAGDVIREPVDTNSFIPLSKNEEVNKNSTFIGNDIIREAVNDNSNSPLVVSDIIKESFPYDKPLEEVKDMNINSDVVNSSNNSEGENKSTVNLEKDGN